MKQESKRLYSIIIAALLIGAALLAYFAFIVPAYAHLEAIKGQEESETTLYANEQKIVAEGKTLLANYQSDASSSQAVSAALPVGQNLAGAIAQVYGIAGNTGVTVQGLGISVQAVTSPDASAGGQIAGAATAGSVIKPTGSILFNINGSGSYEALKAFLQELETNLRIFDVTSISLQPAPIVATKNQASNQDAFTYSITATTYYESP
jgi:Tfp pilus assembly protein PilO